MEITRLKTFIQSTNINFLFGSGMSSPYLSTLGNIENILTELSKCTELTDETRKIIKASIYKEYFTKVIEPNLKKKREEERYNEVIFNYTDFFTIWNEIINKRANSLLPKQINIYTTNIDTLVENASEKAQIEFNDGFKGSVNQIFDESNFQKSLSKRSLHFQNTSEIPVFNYIKMHGSINWRQDTEDVISNDCTLDLVKEVSEKFKLIDESNLVACSREEDGKCVGISLVDMIEAAKQILKTPELEGKGNDKFQPDDMTKFDDFFSSYDHFVMVNPTKHKFVETVMDVHFYDLMRMYSNSLEKENSLLFVMGFSFADEHIKQITLRAAKTNPTLLIVVFAYSDEDFEKYHALLTPNPNNNICIITPKDFVTKNSKKELIVTKSIEEFKRFDLLTLNKVFKIINDEIPILYGE